MATTIPTCVRNSVNIAYLASVDQRISRTKATNDANGKALEAMDYFRGRGFRVKVDTIERTNEYKISLYFGYGPGTARRLVVATGISFWSTVRSVLFPFLQD